MMYLPYIDTLLTYYISLRFISLTTNFSSFLLHCIGSITFNPALELCASYIVREIYSSAIIQ